MQADNKKVSMSKLLMLLLVSIFIGHRVAAQDADETAVRAILAAQIDSWNAGDIDRFMSGYWKNDSLMFIGKAGVTYGYDSTLARYRRTYPTRESMGTLIFDIRQVKKLSPEYYWVLGRWTLKRKTDEPGGHYTLLFRKIHDRWVIIADHTS